MKLFGADRNSGMIRKSLEMIPSFRTNPKFSVSFRNLYPKQTVLFRFNPKKFFNPNQSEAHSKSIWMNPFNPINANETEFFGIIWIDSVWPDLFGLIRIDRITSTDWFWMGLGLIRIETNFGLDRNETVWCG